MTLLADLSDSLGFAVMLLISVSIPGVGLILSCATFSQRGLNKWCATSSILFFATLLVTCVMWVLAGKEGANEYAVLYTLLGCGAMYCISALVALRGIAQTRTRRKWTHGKRRAVWTFSASVLILFALAGWCFFHVNETIYSRLMR